MSDYNREQFSSSFMLAMFGAVAAPMDEEAIERERQADAKQRGDEAVAFRLLDGQIREGAQKERQADAAKRVEQKQFEQKLFQQNAERNRALAQRDRDLSR